MSNSLLKDVKVNKKVTIFTIILFCVALISLVSVLIMNKGYQNIEESRDTRLMLYEVQKMWVLEEVSNYLRVKDQDSFRESALASRLEPWLKDVVYGTSYVRTNFFRADAVSFVDAQYSFVEDGEVVHYVVAEARKLDLNYTLHFLVYTKDNMITDLKILNEQEVD